MKKSIRTNVDNLINELSGFLEKDYSSRFRNLSEREDRQLFYLAGVLTRLKKISEELKEEEKIIAFPRILEEQNV